MIRNNYRDALKLQEVEQQFGFDAFDDKEIATSLNYEAKDMSFIEVFDALNAEIEKLGTPKTKDQLKAKQTLLLAKANLIKNFKDR